MFVVLVIKNDLLPKLILILHELTELLYALFIHFYRAMHYSAKRGLAIACRLSVTLVDQDHISWKSWKLIARTLSPTPSLFGTQRSSTYSQGNMGKFWGH